MSDNGSDEGGAWNSQRKKPLKAQEQSDSDLSVLSSTKFDILKNLNDEDENKDLDTVWKCEKCLKEFKDLDDKVLECHRCNAHYCIKCLKKTATEYKALSKPDTMWFCSESCHDKVTKTIATDLSIERKCQELREYYDMKIRELESTIASQKMSEDTIRKIINDEMSKVRPTAPPPPDFQKIMQEEIEKAKKEVSVATAQKARGEEDNTVVTTVLSELTETEKRQNNMVIYGVKELTSNVVEDRVKHDKKEVIKVARFCEADVDEESFAKVIRLGKHDPEKTRPLLVEFCETKDKKMMFRHLGKLREAPEDIKKYSISHDFTKIQREEEKRLREEAKKREAASSGEALFRVRGPPWNRQVRRIPLRERNQASQAQAPLVIRTNQQSSNAAQPEKISTFGSTPTRRVEILEQVIEA